VEAAAMETKRRCATQTSPVNAGIDPGDEHAKSFKFGVGGVEVGGRGGLQSGPIAEIARHPTPAGQNRAVRGPRIARDRKHNPYRRSTRMDADERLGTSGDRLIRKPDFTAKGGKGAKVLAKNQVRMGFAQFSSFSRGKSSRSIRMSWRRRDCRRAPLPLPCAVPNKAFSEAH
jgi:hypothetical protein